MNSTQQNFLSPHRVKEEYKNLASGMSSQANQTQSNIMMEATVIEKKQEDEKNKINNRIIKLRRDEEKANKRVKDLQRRHKFVYEMNEQKTAHMNELNQHFKERKDTQ